MDNEADRQLAVLKDIAAEIDAMDPSRGTAAFTKGLQLAQVHLDSVLNYLKLERQIEQSTSQTQGDERTLTQIAAEIDAIEPGRGTIAFTKGLQLIHGQLDFAFSKLKLEKEIDQLDELTREIQRMSQRLRQNDDDK